MNETRKFYKREVSRILNKIERREMWLQSDEANKTDPLSRCDRGAVEREVILLRRDMTEAKMMLEKARKQELAEAKAILKKLMSMKTKKN